MAPQEDLTVKKEICKYLPRNNHLCQPKREVWAVPGRRAGVPCSGSAGGGAKLGIKLVQVRASGCANGIARAHFDAAASPMGMVQMRLKSKSKQTTEGSADTTWGARKG